MIYDQRVGEERQQFATQAMNIPPEARTKFEDKFNGNESTEFYEGLLAGYACSYQIVQFPNAREVLGTIIAYLSEILEERSMKTK